MNLYSFSALCFAFGGTLTAILVLVKRRDRVAYRFFVFSLMVSAWSYLFSLWISQQFSSETALWLVRVSYIFVIFIPTTWLHLVLVLIEKKEPFKYFYFINYGISFILSSFCLSDFVISDMLPFLNFKYLPTLGFLHHFHMTHFVILVFFGLYFLLKKYLTVKGYEKDQLRYFAWGTLIGFVSGSSIYLTFYRIPLPLYHLALLPLYPIFTGIALIKYGLFDAQQIAEAFQREKLTTIGIMAASLNHELRNPLYVAKGKIEIYRDAVEREIYPTKEDRQRNADAVLSAAASQLQRAMDIIQRFSDFSKPFNTNRDKQKFLIKDLLCEVKELVSHEFQIQRIEWREEIQEGLGLYANRRQIEEVFLNLILNACHAMEESGGELFFKAAQSQNKIMIEISDTGSGISGENLQRIFEPFYSTKQEKGTGLGLYITKRLVEKNGAKIQVRSKLGQGTTFALIFPVVLGLKVL